MPILGEEPSLFPDNLLDDWAASPTDRQWWVLYTRARQEKALSRELVAHQIPFYLPLVKKTTARRGRKLTSHLPLFSGYIFLFASEKERIVSLTTNRISRVLTVSDPQQLCHDLGQLRRLIACNAPLTVESRLSPGARVRVRQGALMGMEGIVLIRRGVTRLVVSIDFLQQGASLEIEDFLLEPVD